MEYFCGNSENPTELDDRQQRRMALYHATSTLLRSYANLANDMEEAGFDKAEAVRMRQEVLHYESVRSEMKLASGDYIDLKAYEPAMRHLIDTYIDAEESKRISAFDNTPLIDMIVREGVGGIDKLPDDLRKDKEAVAEVIANNVRRLIVEERPTNPKYYDRMSVLLDEVIQERRSKSLDYAIYLERLTKLVRDLRGQSGSTQYPSLINTEALRALYDNMDGNEQAALKVNEAIVREKPDDWRGNRTKERIVWLAIRKVLEELGLYSEDRENMLLDLARNQHGY